MGCGMPQDGQSFAKFFFTIIVAEISSKIKPEILNYQHGFDSMFQRSSMV
jgi:hypothetical protein